MMRVTASVDAGLPLMYTVGARHLCTENAVLLGALGNQQAIDQGIDFAPFWPAA